MKVLRSPLFKMVCRIFQGFILMLFASVSLQDSYRLNLILEALDKGLQFMENHVQEVNLDGVFGVRFMGEQLQAFLKFEPDVFENIHDQVVELRGRAEILADEGEKYVREKEKEYDSTVGGLMERNTNLLWYPSRRTSIEEVLKPKPCSQSAFNETVSDLCFQHMMGSRDSRTGSCTITSECEAMNTALQQRGYVLTHQVLYWQLLEARNCTRNVSPILQINFCSNVMRDAEEIAHAKFPLNHQDLFMEQIGLCGIWGFEDFHKLEWLTAILQWQLPSGCFAHRAKWHCRDRLIPDAPARTKRREKVMEDGCLSHKTVVALLALAVSLRFEAESLYD